MNDLSRRDLLKSAAAVSVAAFAAPTALAQNTIAMEKSAMPLQTGPAFTWKGTPKALSFDPAKLNGLSEKLIRSHWENNYGGAVTALAVVKKQLADALANK